MRSWGRVGTLTIAVACALVGGACGSSTEESQPTDVAIDGTAGTRDTSEPTSSEPPESNDDLLVVEGDSGEYRLVVPAGAVGSDVVISISELPAADDLDGFEGLVRRFELEPSGLRFAEPATFVLTLPAFDVTPDDATVFTAAFLGDADTTEVTPTTTTQVGDDLVITAEVAHFSELELFPAVDRGIAGRFEMTPPRMIAEYDVPFNAQANIKIDAGYEASEGEIDESDLFAEAIGINDAVGVSAEQIVGDRTDNSVDFAGTWVCRRDAPDTLPNASDQYGFRFRWAPNVTANVLELIALRLGADVTDLPDILEQSKWTFAVAGVVECVEPGGGATTTTSTTITAGPSTTTTVVVTDPESTDALGSGVDTHVELPELDVSDAFFVPYEIDTFRDGLGNVYFLFRFVDDITPDVLTGFSPYSRAIEVAAGPPGDPNTFLELTQHDDVFSMAMSRERADLWITEANYLLWDTGLATESAYSGEAIIDVFVQPTPDSERETASFTFEFGSPQPLDEQGSIDVGEVFTNRIEITRQ